MIYSTNRTASLGDVTVDVNESYFGAGMLDFMQENAQDELALFEAAIKSDIDEVLIGESSYELEALNEGFVQNAANKIKEMMKKFIEWLQSVMRSAIAKLSQLLVRDNAKFAKNARVAINKMKNSDKFKFSGKIMKKYVSISELPALKEKEGNTDSSDSYYAQAETADEAKLDELKASIEKLLSESKNLNTREDFEKDCIEEVTDVKGSEAIKIVKDHLDILDELGSKDLQKLRKKLKKLESDAKHKAKKADSAAKKYSGNDELQKKRLNVMAQAANASKEIAQSLVSDSLYMIKQEAKIARAVVAKAMGATPKNEGYYDDEELVDAMIEAANYEYDEALEEMSESKKSDDIDDDEDIEDDED